MAFAIGLIIGAAATFMVMCIIASKKMLKEYAEGFNAGWKYGYNAREEAGVEDE